MASQQLSTNTFGVAKWIVSPTASNGTHTTITAAIASASSGENIFIRPGTYTEDFSLKSGVNLVAFVGDEVNGNVTVVGKMTYTGTGLVSLTGIRFATNSDNILSFGGSSGAVVNFQNCYFLVRGNVAGISYTTGNVNSALEIYDCEGDVSDTSSQFFASSSTGTIIINNSILTNGLSTATVSTTASTASAGKIYAFSSDIDIQITTSSTAGLYLDKVTMSSSLSATTQNATRVTCGGSGAQTIVSCNLSSGTASAVSLSTATTILDTSITSSNANAIAGSGALTATNINFNGSSSTIAPTITPLVTQIGTLNLSTALTVPNGGTGRATLTNHGVLVGAATSAITQLSAGTAGQVLQSGGASADPAYSTATYPATAGTSGNVLKSDGTNIVSSSFSGNRVLIQSQTASASSSITFSTGITGYDRYELDIYGVTISSGDAQMYMQLSTDGGSSWITTSTYYTGGFSGNAAGGAGAYSSNGSSSFLMEAAEADSTTNPYAATVIFYNMGSSSLYKQITATTISNQNNSRLTCFAGTLTTTTATNAIKFFLANGTMTTGTFKLYGILN